VPHDDGTKLISPPQFVDLYDLSILDNLLLYNLAIIIVPREDLLTIFSLELYRGVICGSSACRDCT
jgi:hypothetical protein